ncbi:MAG: hypothetical protein DME26_21895 [Verrucomicrobia bacterium]|nr:MAG: hypothetical protein DME26_21895 [Verrucomicrobiota bacterium]
MSRGPRIVKFSYVVRFLPLIEASFSHVFNHGFKPHEIAEVRRMIAERRAEIVERWLEHGRNTN